MTTHAHALRGPWGEVRVRCDGRAVQEVTVAGPSATLDDAPGPCPLGARLAAAFAALAAGDPSPAAALPLAPVGTPWQRRVWAAARGIPFGARRTYAELAAALGRPGAARAVGRALAANPFLLLVPCHRVVPRGGGVGGFAAGPERKAAWLAWEAATARRTG
jgi:methylated-DNA-[protein]-cysteine S-methyltransferase